MAMSTKKKRRCIVVNQQLLHVFLTDKEVKGKTASYYSCSTMTI